MIAAVKQMKCEEMSSQRTGGEQRNISMASCLGPAGSVETFSFSHVNLSSMENVPDERRILKCVLGLHQVPSRL